MSGNADRSLTYRIQLASNRTKQWYKLQLEEEKRRNQDNVQRPILADPSEERPLYERMGSLAVYRDGVLYLPSPALGLVEITPVGPTPSPDIPQDLISWVLSVDISGYDASSILSEGANNGYYYARYYSYVGTGSSITFYDASGSVLSTFGPNTASNTYNASALSFTRKDTSGQTLYWFNGMDTDLSNVPTLGFNNSAILPRSAVSSGGRIYQIVPYGNPSYVAGATTLRISQDTSANVVDIIPQDVSGHYDCAVVAFDASGGYLFNNSFRTADVSDNVPNYSIRLSTIGTTSDEGYIVGGNFSTQQVRMYDSSGAGGGFTGLVLSPRRLQSGELSSADTFTASFDANGAFRFYNYIRSSGYNIDNSANILISDIAIESNDAYTIIGTYTIGGTPGARLQFFNQNSTSLVAYDTSGYLIFPFTIASTFKNIFVAKYSALGTLQWTALLFHNAANTISDESYIIKNLSNGVVFHGLFGGVRNNSLVVYQGKTPAQQDTSGVSFVSMPLDVSNNNNYNPIMVRYDNNGTVLWSKIYQGFYGREPFSSVNQTAIPLLVDTNDNIYAASSWMYDVSNQLTLRGYRPSTQFINFTLTHSGSGRNTVITSIGTDISGTPNWYAHIRNVSTVDQSGNYIMNAALLSDNSQVYLIRYYSDIIFRRFTSTGAILYETLIPKSPSSTSVPAVVLLRISQNGESIAYVRSTTYQIDINNSLSVDTSNNVYITGNLYSASPSVGQTAAFVNQDGNTVASFVKRTNKQNEAFTLKILSTFTNTNIVRIPEAWLANIEISGNIAASASANPNNQTFIGPNVSNNNYIIRDFRNINLGSYIKYYNKDDILQGTTTENTNNSTYAYNTIMFLKNDGSLANIYSYKNVNNTLISILSGSNTLSINVAPSRITRSPTRIFHGTIYGNPNSLVNGNQMIIYNKNNAEVGSINIDISGNRNDSALICYDENSNYLFNRSLRTSSISDIGNSIVVRHLNSFSDNSVIVGGDFTTNEIRIYNESNTQLGLIQIPEPKTSPRANDNFLVKFDSAGNLLHYNYVRTNLPGNNVANCRLSYINLDSSNNYYVAGSFASQTNGLFQIYDVNSTSAIVYDTSGYQGNLNTPPGNNLYVNPGVAVTYLNKYNSNGNFQWFAPIYSDLSDNVPDLAYYVGSVGQNVLAVYYASWFLNTVPGYGRLVRIYNGKTAAQRNTSGVLYTSVDLSNNTQGTGGFGPILNQIMVNYDSSGQVQWVKSFQGYYRASIENNNVTLLYHTDSANNILGSTTSRKGNGFIDFNDYSPSKSLVFRYSLFGGILASTDIRASILYSLTSGGALRWYAGLENSSTDSNGNEVRWSGLTSSGDFVALIQYYSQMNLNIYNSAGTLLKTLVIPKSSSESLQAILVLKISNDGQTVQYIRNTGIYAFTCNNGLTIDSNNNVYITINDGTVPFGTSVNFVNQNYETITSFSRINNTGNTNELMTIKIPASFTAY